MKQVDFPIIKNEQRYQKTLTKIYVYKFFAWFHLFSAILITFFTDWAGLTIFQLMVLEAWFGFCMLLLEIPTGAIADFLGRKPSLQSGLIMQALGFAIYVSFPNFFVYMLGETFIAFGFALISGAEEAFVYDTLKSFNKEVESKKVFGKFESAGLAGIMLASPLGSLIGDRLGLHYPMLLMFLPLTIAFVLLFFIPEPVVTQNRKAKKSSYLKIIKKGITIFYQHRPLKILALDLVVLTTMGFLIIWLYQLMLKAAGVPLFFFGMVNILLVPFEILLLNNYSRLEIILKSKKKLLFWCGLIVGVMFIVGGLTDYVPLLILVIVLVGGFSLTRRPLIVNYMNKFIDSEERATVLSSASMLVSLSKMLFFPIVGLIIERISLSVALIILGIITILFIFFSKIEEEHLLD